MKGHKSTKFDLTNRKESFRKRMVRKSEKLMTGWLFTSPDGNTKSVELPHTWNGKDGQDGGNDYMRNQCIYQKTFAKPGFEEQTECVYLEFAGVNASCKVCLNGKEITSHDGGYSTFRVEITEQLQEENELVLYVDNKVGDKVYPQRADFTFYGGIYRDVTILTVSRSHFDLDYFGGPGIQLTPKVEGPDGVLTAEAYVTGAFESVCWNVLDHTGATVACAEGTTCQIEIPKIHLWDGISDPYLYTVCAELICDGEVTDCVEQKIGFRSYRFDPEQGFFLNGRSYPLHGVSRHQDWKDLGNAITKEHHDKDMELIREVGANSIRLAHYQHDQYFYDLCDQYGMVVWAEIPYISEHLVNGRDNTVSQMKELIIQNYHHASIVTWGISNEITIKDKNRADMLDNHHMLNDLVHEMDPSRPTTLACYAMCMPTHKVVHITDLVGYNLYLGWYVPFPWLNDLFLKGFHKIWPKRPLCYSEYGAEGMSNLHSSRPKRGDHTEEYQAVYHEYMLECFKRHPFMWGTYVWNMFDFAADARDQGGEPGMNHKGLITFDRKIKKDSFYLYKAYWSEEAFVHICGRRYVDRTQKKSKIKVYSNCSSVALYQNGKLAEEKQGAHIFEFSVVLEKENTFEVRTKEGCTDQIQVRLVETPNPAYKLKKTKSKNWV